MHLYSAWQMDLLEENTEKSCLLQPQRIQQLSPVAANLITLEVRLYLWVHGNWNTNLVIQKKSKQQSTIYNKYSLYIRVETHLP